MAYGVIVPAFWDHDELAECSLAARLVAAFLLTARESQLVPGLVNLGVGGMAEAARIPVGVVVTALAELTAIGFVEVDERRRLIRVPNAPRYNRAANPNMIRGWFRRWQMLPRCELRDRHVASLREGFADSDAMQTAWLETFGNVPEMVPVAVSKPFPNGSMNRLETNGVGVGVDLSSSLPPDPDAREATPQLDLVPTEPGLDVAAVHDAAFAAYPASRRVGKAKGLAALRASLRTPEDAESFARVVEAHKASASGEQYMRQWERLCRTWRELPEVAPARASPTGDVTIGQYRHTGNEAYQDGEVDL